ncbi:hypothetical protein [Polyangium sp. y55x31]|uniref:hypothetical protein n=1 Tax=Polyangium sp. y55x31 TaxID=3042688 RepID=UPI002482A11E|nr:hypothetical protein [Polyangium sp. y55x31]MDI1475970.1 hypothetical protein [Polyangium sp. y55x31]
MAAVNAYYDARRHVPRVGEFQIVTTLLKDGKPDKVVKSRQKVYIKDRKARVDTVETEVLGATPPARADLIELGFRQIWIHDGRETKWLSILPEPDEGGGPAKVKIDGVVVRHYALPPNLPNTYIDPLRTVEISPEFFEAQLTAEPLRKDGTAWFVLRTGAPMFPSYDVRITRSALWVDARTLEVRRIEMDIEEDLTPGAPPARMSVLLDSELHWGVPIDEGMFTLELPAGARDVTASLAERARRTLLEKAKKGISKGKPE